MSDLISRSELLETIERYGFSAIANDKEREYIKNIIIKTVQEQPTAYDIDKVIEKLEKEKNKFTPLVEQSNKAGDFTRAEIYSQMASEYTTAIEIVKQGGVSDDCCEWQSESDGEFIRNPHTKRLYSNEPSMKNIYCNTCGNKIKIVGD